MSFCQKVHDAAVFPAFCRRADPLDKTLGVAIAPLAEHCVRLFQAGCDGVVLFGTTGEGTFFSVTEKLAALRRLIATGLDPSRVVVASGACALEDAATTVATARELGCKGVLVLPPFFTKQIEDEGLGEWMDALVKRSAGGTVYLYHIPRIAGVGFSPALAERLLTRPDGVIRGVKDSMPDASLARTLAGRGHAGVYVSSEIDLRSNLAAGMEGTISASLNITLPLLRRTLASSDASAEAAVAAIRTHLAKHSLIWAVKTAIADQTRDPVWRRLAPPHRAPADELEAAFLSRLHSISMAAA